MLDVDTHTPDAGGSSVTYEALTFHSDSMNLDMFRPQYPHIVARGEFLPLTPPSGVLPNAWQGREEEIEYPMDSFRYARQLLPPLETTSDCHLTSPLVDDFVGDEPPSHCKNDEDSIDGRVSSPVLSADEWKYVLVGMKIAMTAG